jgi:hypothetical protein
VLGGGALEILHVTSESDSEAAKSERHSSPDKSTGETEEEVLSED